MPRFINRRKQNSLIREISFLDSAGACGLDGPAQMLVNCTCCMRVAVTRDAPRPSWGKELTSQLTSPTPRRTAALPNAGCQILNLIAFPFTPPLRHDRRCECEWPR